MSEEKIRIHTRITPETERKIEAAMSKANCQSRNEFLEKALLFYCNYLAAEDVAEFLPPILIKSLRATVQGAEDRIARVLFKLAVETGMMMNVLASGMEIPAGELDRLRGMCIRDIKRSNGNISLKDTVKRQDRIE